MRDVSETVAIFRELILRQAQDDCILKPALTRSNSVARRATATTATVFRSRCSLRRRADGGCLVEALRALLESEECVVALALAQEDVGSEEQMLRPEDELGVGGADVVDVDAAELDVFSRLAFRGA